MACPSKKILEEILTNRLISGSNSYSAVALSDRKGLGAQKVFLWLGIGAKNFSPFTWTVVPSIKKRNKKITDE
jgi:hypothetical protein